MRVLLNQIKNCIWLKKLLPVVYILVFLLPFGVLWSCLLFKNNKHAQETLKTFLSKLKNLSLLDVLATVYGVGLMILSLIPSANFYFLTLFAFVPFGFLLMLRKKTSLLQRKYVVKILLVSLSLSILIEFKQLYVPINTEADLFKILYGMMGTLLGVYVFTKAHPLLKKYKVTT